MVSRAIKEFILLGWGRKNQIQGDAFRLNLSGEGKCGTKPE
jgi:hypothetical protein